MSMNLFQSVFSNPLCILLVIKEHWAVDNNKVQEFMFGYLNDPLREVGQPYFEVDEVQKFSSLFLVLG